MKESQEENMLAVAMAGIKIASRPLILQLQCDDDAAKKLLSRQTQLRSRPLRYLRSVKRDIG